MIEENKKKKNRELDLWTKYRGYEKKKQRERERKRERERERERETEFQYWKNER